VQPNIPSSLAIKRKLFQSFWDQVRNSIGEKLNENGQTNWQAFKKGDPFKRGEFQIFVGSSRRQKDIPEFSIVIEQDLPNDFSYGPFNLDYGVWCIGELSENTLEQVKESPEYHGLQEVLKRCEFLKDNECWPGWKRKPMGSLDQFLESFNDDNTRMVSEVVDEFWNLFLEIHPSVTRMNQAMSRLSQAKQS
jgi:hypothetical protein